MIIFNSNIKYKRVFKGKERSTDLVIDTRDNYYEETIWEHLFLNGELTDPNDKIEDFIYTYMIYRGQKNDKI